MQELAVKAVEVSSLRDLHRIPGEMEVKPEIDDIIPWRFSKTYQGVEYFCFYHGGEE
jgi:hypothetical protein